MCGSTCFGRLSAHHQERTTALGTSDFTVEAWRLERCWSWPCETVAFCWLICLNCTMMAGFANVKFINAKQAGDTYLYKNIKRKLDKTIAATWFNKTCKDTNFINIKINGNNRQSNNTMKTAVLFRLNQEIKYLYIKKADHDQQRSNRHSPTVKPEALSAVLCS
jgi:hypothetical protein